MTGPIDAILAFHYAFRRDIRTTDTAALDMARAGENPGVAINNPRRVAIAGSKPTAESSKPLTLTLSPGARDFEPWHPW